MVKKKPGGRTEGERQRDKSRDMECDKRKGQRGIERKRKKKR